MVNGTPAQNLHQLVMLDHTEQKLAQGRKLLDRWRNRELDMPQPQHGKEDEMRIVSSGDVHVVTPQPVQPQQQSSGLGSLIGAALVGASLVGIPGAGIASYLYAKSQAEPAKPDTTVIEQREDLGLGLLKLEDLKQ